MRPSTCPTATARTGPVWPVTGSPIGGRWRRPRPAPSRPRSRRHHGAALELPNCHRGDAAGVAADAVRRRGRRCPRPAPSRRLRPETITGRPSTCPTATAHTPLGWSNGSADQSPGGQRPRPAPSRRVSRRRRPSRPSTCPSATARHPAMCPMNGSLTGVAVAGVPDPHRPVLGAGDDHGAARHLPDRHRAHAARCGR